ncbi:MAG: hypothetical protein WKF74_02940 [Pyrinomonadaceae bacterium]
MRLTPQLQQRLDLLQMTSIELNAFIKLQILDNPVLEKITLQEVHNINEAAFEESAITPDVCIEEANSDYIIYFPNDSSSSLRISDSYIKLVLGSAATNSEMRESIKRDVRLAVDLLRNVEHRRQSIHRVVEYIVRNQHEFLVRGVDFIKADSLEGAASATGMSISLISYVINRKHVDTRHGLIELRLFFKEEKC